MERRSPGLLGAIRIDVTRLHDTWMEVAFPRQLDASSVLGKWQPETTPQRIAYKLWAAIGIPLVLFGYPLLLVGFATRYYATRLDSAVTRIGVLGVLLVATLVWGTLTLITRLQLTTEAFLAVGAASVVAIVSAGLAALFSKVGGRATSVLLAYPFAMTALFLPPVVAALFTPSLGEVIFPNSTELAVWILDTLLAVGGLNDWLRANFTLEGTGYVLMWFGLAIPTGWLLGLLVALADVIRPKPDE
ncbi:MULTISPECIES: hypothetical protein [Halopenitus]|uniref:Uncharacterized protein n=1 Tax=Halopenitus malekzadehii TaxID=1267564 RepID=A0A1H6HYG9_9EURY|nr:MULTISPECIES: hypothetical protein [Halopenitus]SEH39228.1 hypothetical protein SAMN05192561_101476 [Halopenitus malekzadehii]